MSVCTAKIGEVEYKLWSSYMFNKRFMSMFMPTLNGFFEYYKSMGYITDNSSVSISINKPERFSNPATCLGSMSFEFCHNMKQAVYASRFPMNYSFSFDSYEAYNIEHTSLTLRDSQLAFNNHKNADVQAWGIMHGANIYTDGYVQTIYPCFNKQLSSFCFAKPIHNEKADFGVKLILVYGKPLNDAIYCAYKLVSDIDNKFNVIMSEYCVKPHQTGFVFDFTFLGKSDTFTSKQILNSELNTMLKDFNSTLSSSDFIQSSKSSGSVDKFGNGAIEIKVSVEVRLSA